MYKWYRVAKTHRMPYLYRSFSAKEPYNQWLICEKWPATWGILSVFATLYIDTYTWEVSPLFSYTHTHIHTHTHTRTHTHIHTHTHILQHTLTYSTYISIKWLRLVGSLKWYVSFAEYSPFYRALLQKRTVILRSLLIVATQYEVATVSRIDEIIGLFCRI